MTIGRVLVVLLAWSGCNCGPAPIPARSDGGVDAGPPVFGVYLCQSLCDRTKPQLERDFGVARVDCGQFPVFTSSCLECGALFERKFGLLPACE